MDKKFQEFLMQQKNRGAVRIPIRSTILIFLMTAMSTSTLVVSMFPTSFSFCMGMMVTHGISNLIREGKTQQIESAVQTGNKYGMRTMDMSLAELCKRGVISQDTAMTYAVDGETLKRLLML